MKLKEKYGFGDFLWIPVKSAPYTTLLLIAENIIEALIPAATVLVTADFIDTSLKVLAKTAAVQDVFVPILLFVLMIIFQQTNGFFNELCYVKLRLGLEKEFKAMIVEKRARLHYTHIENNETWDLITRISDNSSQKILDGFDRVKALAFIAIEIASVLTIILVQVWWTGIIAAIMLIPIIYISLKGGKRNYDAHKKATPFERRADYLSKVLNGRENVEERTTFSYTDPLSEKWAQSFSKAQKMRIKADFKTSVNARMLGFTAIIMSILVAGSMFPAISNQTVSIGMFMALVNAVMSLSNELSWSVSYYIVTLVEALEYLKDFNQFAALSEHAYANDLPDTLSDFTLKSIEFKDVSFCYPETDRYILKGCCLKIEEGLHYAIVGINGAGKTTITKLLTGMYDNYEGEIFINGKNLRSYKITELKAMFSVVYQDFAKYYISLEDNIMLGNVLTHDENKMKEAINKIGLNDAVAKLPQKEKTPLGKIMENGVDLSGGEWQRIAIARTLYSNAKMYILDEPTAALDPITESQVYDAFGEISNGMTTLFITHRLGAARIADKIFVIADGRTLEQGSHDELIALDGVYAEMFESQKGWYENESA